MKKLSAALIFASALRLAGAADLVFHPDQLPEIAAGPGVTLKELVGRNAPAHSTRYSVAQFTLQKNASTATSYNKSAEESYLIVSGKGHVVLGKMRLAVRAGSMVIVPVKVPHSIHADAGEKLVFHAICAPAFTPKDFVIVPPEQR